MGEPSVDAEAAALVLHDSGRLVTEESANVKASLAPLTPGTAFTWRVRTWSIACRSASTATSHPE